MSGTEFDRLMRDGQLWLRSVLAPELVSDLRDTGDQPGRRLKPADIGTAQSALNVAVRQVMKAAQAVRVVGFSKSEGRNWSLSWHQDRVIAVKDKTDTPGFRNWSRKSGVWHCEPPVDVLQRMIFARVLLNPVGDLNGGMRYAVGSHRAGIVRKSDAAAEVEHYPVETETGASGDVLLLPMLTLHASRISKSGEERRVLRVDFAADPLPSPLKWAS